MLTIRITRVKLRSYIMPGKDAIKRLEKEGWRLDRVKGSHHIMMRDNKTIPVPVHGNKDLSKGSLHKIAKLAGWL